MKKCSDDCYPICDFCYYFRNGIELGRDSIENGFCNKHKRNRKLCDSCNYFTCTLCVNIFKRLLHKITIYFLLKFNRRKFFKNRQERLCGK